MPGPAWRTFLTRLETAGARPQMAMEVTLEDEKARIGKKGFRPRRAVGQTPPGADWIDKGGGSMKFRGWLATLIPIVLVAAACSSPSTGSGGAASKLTIAAVQGVEDAGLKALAPMYKQQKGVDIQIVEAPYDDLYSKLVNAFKANDSTYDLIMMDDPWMPKFGTDGSLSDLGAMGVTQDPDIAQVVWDVGTWPPPRGPVPPSEKSKPKQLLGVTIVGNVEMFMYRSDLTPTAPASYADVLTNAKAQNKPGTMTGYIIRGKATNPVVADFLPILWSQGGDVFDENWNVVLDNDASKAAIAFLVNDLKSVAQTDPGSTDASDRDKIMANGQGYASSVWPGEIGTAVLDPAVTKVAGKVAFIPIPKGKSGKGVGMMGN